VVAVSLVTASGNRINHRSLDLQIIWDDIKGVAPPRSEDHPVERLLSWAKVLTGNDSLKSIDRGEDRIQIVESLAHWLEVWEADNTLAKFDMLPDEHLNTAVWKLASGLKRTFGATAEAIASLKKEEGTLVECLGTISELFNDSEAEHDLKTEELAMLNKHVLLSIGRGQMLTYIASADWTGDENVDSLRRELLRQLQGGGVALNGRNDRVTSLWNQYRELYAAHFGAKHAEAMSATLDRQVLKDVVSSELWSAFRGIAELPLTDRRSVTQTEDILRKIRSGGCTADPTTELMARPVCACGNGTDDLDEVSQLPSQLRKTIEHTMEQFRSTVLQRKEDLKAASRGVPGANIDFIIDSLEASKGFPRFSANELRTLSTVCGRMQSSLPTSEAVETEAEIELLSF
jgi:hypothetical protein